jgi:hypothetical protein
MTNNRLNMWLELKKNIEHIIIVLNKINPSIVVMTTHISLGMAPNILKNKLKRSLDYMIRDKKRKLMTLALLTNITNSNNFVTKHMEAHDDKEYGEILE